MDRFKIKDMKKVFLALAYLAFAVTANGQTKNHDPHAILILDRMSDFIGELGSCSYVLDVASDHKNDDGVYKKHLSTFEVFMVGPDKMLVDLKGRKGHREYIYNGEVVSFYYHNENNYGIVDAPGNIMQTIEMMNHDYGIDFPAADIFYPAFTDDLIETFDVISFEGKDVLNGKECFQILAVSGSMVFQLWITNDAMNLPARFVVYKKNEPSTPQYDATFSSWAINPVLPLSMFEFVPPAGSRQVSMLPRR
jgi:hypothetical protein